MEQAGCAHHSRAGAAEGEGGKILWKRMEGKPEV